MIERSVFIKDLFNSKNILNNFNDIEFESFKAFLICIGHDFLLTRKYVRASFPIQSIEEFEKFVKLSTESYFCESINVNLLIKPELLEEVFEKSILLKNKRFSVTTTDLQDANIRLTKIKGFVEWSKVNMLFIKFRIDKDNYKDIPSYIVRNYRMQGIRFYDLSFDYESIEKLTFEEFHLFEFWLNQIMAWIVTSTDKRNDTQPLIINNQFKNRKHLFVSNDIKLYLTRQAYEENEVLFDLWENKKENGCLLPMLELNKFLGYVHLHNQILCPKMNNSSYVDCYQNKKIMGFINEVPHTTILIGDILGAR